MAKPDFKTVIAERKAKESDKAKGKSKEAPVNMEPFNKRFGADKIKEWETTYGGGRKLIYLFVDDKLAVLRPVTADDLGEYMMAIGENGLSKAVAFVIEELWIDGDTELISDEDMFIGVFLQINNMLEGKKAEYFRA